MLRVTWGLRGECEWHPARNDDAVENISAKNEKSLICVSTESGLLHQGVFPTEKEEYAVCLYSRTGSGLCPKLRTGCALNQEKMFDLSIYFE